MTLPARGDRKRAGFALLAVLWGVGLISTMVVAFMSAGRLRLQTASNIANATQANYVAESAANLAALQLIAKRDAPLVDTQTAPAETVYDGSPQFCVLDRAAVALAIEEEGGKIDLNAASPEFLQMALTGFGLDERAAQQIAKSIVDYRTAPTGDIRPTLATDKGIEPKQALFETVLELDQVSGVSPALFKDLLPFVTVSSRSPGVDPRSSPPALFAALTGYPLEDVHRLIAAPYPNKLNREDPRFPANLRQPTDHGAYLIHAEALLATGQTAARDIVLDLRPNNNKPFSFKEFRRGQSRYVDQLRAMVAANGGGAPDC